MDFFFIDDAQQDSPSRPGMGPLSAIGGFYIRDEHVQSLEAALNNLCTDCGFPSNEIFKWSPRRDSWMHNNLRDQAREDFYKRTLALAISKEASAIVVIEDATLRRASRAKTVGIDLINLFVERAHRELTHRNQNGVVIVSQPSGDRRAENKFLMECLETIETGTEYIIPDRIALNFLSAPCRFVRLLQLADLIASCTTAYVAGENVYSPPIFGHIKEMFVREGSKHVIGGYGLKIHPDMKYGNLYHWLVGDSHIWKGCVGYPLPYPRLPYHERPDAP